MKAVLVVQHRSKALTVRCRYVSIFAGLWMAALPLTLPATADWIVDAGGDVRYDDNLPLASKDTDIENDVAFNARMSVGRRYQLTDRLGASVTADLSGAHFARFDGLDHAAAGMTTSLYGKFGLGPVSPWWRLAGGVAARDYDYAPRDGMRYFATAAAGRHFGERLDLQISYAFERRRADNHVDIPFLVSNFGIHGDTFDGDNHSYAINAAYTLTEHLVLLSGYARRTGDVCATTRIDFGIFDVSTAIAPDPVFGIDRFAYRLDADTDIFQLGMSYALGDHWAVNLSYEYRDSNGKGGVTYTSDIAQLGLRYRY